MRGGLKRLPACLPAGGVRAMEGDFLLAQWLQAEWEAEARDEEPAPPPPSRPLSVVDETWELLDPTPDVRGLFAQFNETLFWGRLAAVEVKWSPRMTSCAGVCSYEGRGGMCSIRLSEPLLKLRPRKDLVETLLHEMIHALLFVTDNDKDRDSHGPRFCKHMHRINSLTGANITIYHEFHQEVDSYRQHWWRCNGPCRSRKPYFGYVKRAMNRAPSANDFWWNEHQQTCGGTFTKVKEPENYSKRGKENNKQEEFLPNDKGRTPGSKIQSTIPFSGKGYVLGGKSSIFSSERTTSPSNSKGRELQVSQYHSSADSVRLNRKNEMDLDQNVPYTNTSPLFSRSDKKSSASSITLPKFSVSNKNVYTNVNGSPTRNVNFVGGKSNLNSTNAKWGLLLTGTPKRNTPEPTVSSRRSWTSSQGNDDMHTSGGPPKRAKMEDTSAFKAYFTKGMEPGWTTPSVKRRAEVEQICLEESPESNQNRQISCPVCQSKVLEAKINEHLDSCLSEPLK